MRKTLSLLCVLLPVGLLAQPRPLVITHVTVISMQDESLQRDQTVVITGDRITALGPSGRVAMPKRAQIVRASGKYLIPDLWDAHVHLAKAGANCLPLLIAHGITSVRDMGGDPAPVLEWKKQIAAGRQLGPRIKMAGPILESSSNLARMKREGTVEPVARTRVGIGDPDEAALLIDSVLALGVDFLKVRTVASLATYQAIAQAAQSRQVMLMGHAVAAPEALLEARQRSIEHSFFPALQDSLPETRRRAYFTKLAQQEVYVVPTLVTGKSLLVELSRARAILADSLGTLEPRRKYLSGYLLEDWREQLAERNEYPPNLAQLLTARLTDLREMHRVGVRFLAGTDLAVALVYPGYSLHEELQLLVQEVGLTPFEALLTATRYPAEFFHLQDSLGTIAVGKLADMVLLEANPLENIYHTQHLRGVVVKGRYFDRKALDRLLRSLEPNSKP